MSVTPASSQSQGSPGRQLKRKRTASFRAGTVAAPGLRRYLSLRGTPTGVYEITRTVVYTQRIGNYANAPAGFCFPLGANPGTSGTFNYTLVFCPDQVQMQDTAGTVLGSVSVPNYAEISALFDQVKIDKVELKFDGAWTQISGTLDQAPCTILMCTDDNSTDSSLAAIQQAGDCITWTANNTYQGSKRLTVRPKYQQIVYYTSLLSGYEPKQGYIRSDYSIPHYGVKIAISPNYNIVGSNNPVGMMNVSMKYYLKCKDLK